MLGGKGLIERLIGWIGVDTLETPGSDLQLRLLAMAGLLYLLGYLYTICVTSPWTTRYALTDRRALIRHNFPWPRLREKRLTPATEIEWDGAEPGTILFDEVLMNYGIKPKTKIGTRETRAVVRTGFRRIADAGGVHGLMRDIAEGTAGVPNG